MRAKNKRSRCQVIYEILRRNYSGNWIVLYWLSSLSRVDSIYDTSLAMFPVKKENVTAKLR
jgi:hypothetical protein